MHCRIATHAKSPLRSSRLIQVSKSLVVLHLNAPQAVQPQPHGPHAPALRLARFSQPLVFPARKYRLVEVCNHRQCLDTLTQSPACDFAKPGICCCTNSRCVSPVHHLPRAGLRYFGPLRLVEIRAAQGDAANTPLLSSTLVDEMVYKTKTEWMGGMVTHRTSKGLGYFRCRGKFHTIIRNQPFPKRDELPSNPLISVAQDPSTAKFPCEASIRRARGLANPSSAPSLERSKGPDSSASAATRLQNSHLITNNQLVDAINHSCFPAHRGVLVYTRAGSPGDGWEGGK